MTPPNTCLHGDASGDWVTAAAHCAQDVAGSVDNAEPDDDAVEARTVRAGASAHGKRLDVVLAQLVPEFSRSYLQQLLAAGAVQINGRTALKSAQKVKAADTIILEMRPTLASQAFRPEALPIDVVYEDEHLLVVNKTAGWVVHPAPGNWSGTLLNALLARDAAAASVPRAGIVHRLDKDTSGLMVVARTRTCMDALVSMIAERTVHRQYLALAQGAWQGAATRVVDATIGRDPRNRLRMAVVDLTRHAGKEARTDIKILQTSAKHSWVECTLHTGRTHQIRVHMAHIGLPLVGDTLYGGSAQLGLARQGLHAFRLSFLHPITAQPLEFKAGVPLDLHDAAALAGFDLQESAGTRAQ